MAARTALPAPSLPIERATLSNGLRVVYQPDRTSTTVAVGVYYDVGFRSEPEGRTGFAHLFEHLMFEGSANLAKGEHPKLVQGNGGVMNGSTNLDFTNYYEALPSAALDLALFLEADRMASPNLTEETLHNQIDVVKEEIRVNVLNRPYGGWQFDLPAVMYTTFNNAHNGYGSFVDLESATVEDARDFFDKYYAPANAVLVVAGDIDPDATQKMIEGHFGGIAARTPAPRSDCHEALPTKERRKTAKDPMAPSPMVAMAYRTPDPVAQLHDYLAVVVLCEVLADGEAGRLTQRLVKQDRIAIQIAGLVGAFGDPFESRDPTLMQLLAFYPAGGPEPLLDAIDEEIAKVAEGISEDEVRSVEVAIASRYLRDIDSIMPRAMAAAVCEQQRGRAELINELPTAIGEVTAADVSRVAAEWITPAHRAVLDTQPGGAG